MILRVLGPELIQLCSLHFWCRLCQLAIWIPAFAEMTQVHGLRSARLHRAIGHGKCACADLVTLG